MKNILDEKVTLFNTDSKKEVETDLNQVLEINLNTQLWKKEIECYRNNLDKEYRLKNVPTFISGIVKDAKLNSLVYPTNLLILDIDSKDNKGLDYNLMIKKVKKLDYVSIIVESSGGKGIWIPILLNVSIKSNDLYKQIYKEIAKDFERLGINLDVSCCNINRKRFFGFSNQNKCFIDENKLCNCFIIKDLINSKGKENKALNKPKTNKYKLAFQRLFEAENKNKIEALLNIVEYQKIDIETTFQDWKSLAQSLYNVFNNEGLNYFLKFTKYYIHGDDIDKDLKMWESVKDNTTKYDLSKVFQLAKKYGIGIEKLRA